LYDVVFVVTR